MVGRPRKYNNRVMTSLSLEKEVLDQAVKSGISLTEIFLKGWAVITPSGMTGGELRRKQIKRKIREVEDKKEILDEELFILNNEVREVADEMMDFGKIEKDREKKVKKLLPDFWAQMDMGGKKPNWDEDDPEMSGWWTDRNIDMTYGELIKRWVD